MMSVRIRNYLSYTLIALLGVLIAAPLMAQDPYTMPNNSWISIDGEVASVSPNMFILDYGDGSVAVEMDDGDRDADAYKLLKGDRVNVFGKVDDDFLEATTIEASSVYVEKLGTHFYASSVDEEDTPVQYIAISDPVVVSATILQGTVSDVRKHEFTINTGGRAIDVDVSSMGYNPLDDEGYQKVNVGDRVWVSGKMDHNLFEGRELIANTIVMLDDVKVVRPDDQS